MKLLVITPTLGTSHWLVETVASVAGLPFACHHVLICPAAVQSDLAQRFPQTQVIPEPGGGMYAAINAGISDAKGDWDAFTYVNDDDLLLPGLAASMRAMERVPGAPLITYGHIKLIDGNGRRLGAIPISPRPSLNRALYAQRIEPVFQHGTLVSRAAFRELRGFDATLRFCGDSEFLARACLTGLPFVRVGGAPVAAFRLRPGQLTKNRPAMQAERAQVDVKLGLLAPQPAAQRWKARFLFRTANLPVYVERVARHGFVSFDELVAQT